MIDVKNTLDATIASLKSDGVTPTAVTLNLVHRTLLAGQLKSMGLHDGFPEHLNDYNGLPIRLDPSPAGSSAVNGRRPGLAAAVSQLLVNTAG
jgi:hypothetical protein